MLSHKSYEKKTLALQQNHGIYQELNILLSSSKNTTLYWRFIYLFYVLMQRITPGIRITNTYGKKSIEAYMKSSRVLSQHWSSEYFNAKPLFFVSTSVSSSPSVITVIPKGAVLPARKHCN